MKFTSLVGWTTPAARSGMISGYTSYQWCLSKMLTKCYHIGVGVNVKTHNMNFLIQKIFLDSVGAVNPARLVRESMRKRSKKLYVEDKVYNLTKNVHVVGFGKAVLSMACESERILDDCLTSGVICVPKNTQETFKHQSEFQLKNDSVIKVFEGAEKNLPDEDAEQGAGAIIELVQKLTHDDILIILISGGGSALLPKPKPGISLFEKMLITKMLASCGANIHQINTVRKKLSVVKGGGLAELSYPVTTICLILSDVISNPLDIIASGPTVPNTDSMKAAYEIIEKYRLELKVPRHVLKTLKEEEGHERGSIPVSHNKYPHVDNFIIGNNKIAVEAGKKTAKELGFQTVILSTEVEGLVHYVADFYSKLSFAIIQALTKRDVPRFYGELNMLMRSCHFRTQINFRSDVMHALKNVKKGVCIIAGGEPTVHVNNPNGMGGRSLELAINFSQNIQKLKNKNSDCFKNYDVIFLSAGTDGIDGPTDVAGAIGSSELIDIGMKCNLNVNQFLAHSDSYNYLKEIDHGSFFVKTGHTGTNVMDIHIIIVYDKGETEF